MSTGSAYLTVRGIGIDVVYKDYQVPADRRLPANGSRPWAAPTRLDDEHVRLAVVQRLHWIKRQRDQLQAVQRQSEREMITGEAHYA
jgi:predicted metal-dependent hydrolase